MADYYFLAHVRYARVAGPLYGGDFDQPIAISLISSFPRWRLARALESDRRAHHGGIAHGSKSFSDETKAIVEGGAG